MLGNIPVSVLQTYIDKSLPDGWVDYETETIVMELGVPYSELLGDKINLLRVFKVVPTLFFEDPLFFLHAVDVINNNVADFDHVPSINSLELAYGLVEAAKIVGAESVEASPSYQLGIRELVKHILKNDGYSEVCWPFDTVGVTGLGPSDFPEDMIMKRKAIKEYIDGISSKSTN